MIIEADVETHNIETKLWFGSEDFEEDQAFGSVAFIK